MPRRGITDERILEEALNLVDQKGMEYFTIQKLAKQLNIKAPSLYNHIQSLAELRLRMSIRVNTQLLQLFQKVVGGKKRREAILALALAYRDFALSHPGLYQLSIVFPSQKEKHATVFIAQREFFGRVIQEGYNLSGEEVRSAARTIRSLIHGFVSLELVGGWSQVVDAQISFNHALEYIISGIDMAEQRRQNSNSNQISI